MTCLKTRVTGIELRHPIMNASGVLALSEEALEKLIESNVSAIVTKTLTLKPREGYPPPIIVPIGNGLVNAVGLANPGIDALPFIVDTVKKETLPVIASIGGKNIDEYLALAVKAEEAGVDAIELNLSCPNVLGYGLHSNIDTGDIVKNVKGSVKIPVWAKLGFSKDIVEEAGKALSNGADALVLINTLPATVIDVYAMKPVLSNKVGGLSGPPIHPIMLYTVYTVYREYKCEIIGVGGVTDWASTIDTILAGARAVQIATAFYLKGYGVVNEILNGIKKYMEEQGIKHLEELIGKAHD